MAWLGIDIGGANLKLADGLGFAESRPFAMWKNSDALCNALAECIASAPRGGQLAVTMTAELADCFATKAEGVRFVLDAVDRAAAGRRTLIYLRDGRFVASEAAALQPLEAAAANWHALARFAARFADRPAAVLLDIGSTTCDVVPIVEGAVCARGTTDTERLIAGELVYTGVERSPVACLVDLVPYRGQLCPVVQELFATMHDVHVITGDLPESAAAEFSADGRPHLRAYACARLARMIAADSEMFDDRDATELAQAAVRAQTAMLAERVRIVVESMPRPPEVWIVSGHGEFLARRAINVLPWPARVVSLAREIGQRPSRCAPAHALAVLASEAFGP